MAFSELRNLSLSLHWRLYTLLRQQGWFYTDFGVDLEPISEDEPLVFHNPEIKRPFVFLDNNAEVWPSGVKVYDAGIPLPSGRYVVDYMKSQITLTIPPSGDVTADLAIYTVGVHKGYLEGEELNKHELPLIAYDIETDENESFGIGTQQKWRDRECTIDIYAMNDGERLDLTDHVGRFIRRFAYVDHTEHQPLDENNRLDPLYSFADQWDGDLHMPDGVRGDLLKPRQEGSDKERHRALVAFTVQRVS